MQVNIAKKGTREMNTNELANKLEQGHWEGGTREQAAVMLRTIPALEAEIEALKNRNWNLVSETWGFDRQPTDLTDEEIYYCWSHSYGNTPWMKQKAFARAILRKAKE